MDFTAWPARGTRTGDRSLLARALGTWAAPPYGTAVTVAPSASAEPPGHPPQLLFAGDPRPGTAVVVFRDADRVVRYTEQGGRRSLDIARTDDANVTTAASVTLSRDGGTARRLLAPWIATAGVRDLAAPATAARPLTIGPDGTVTTEFPREDADRQGPDADAGGGAGGGGCGPRPVLEVASSPRIVEKHAFLLAALWFVPSANATAPDQSPGRSGPSDQRNPPAQENRATLSDTAAVVDVSAPREAAALPLALADT
ncbi:hypothetical protein ACFV9E_39995, partial [Streptomyces sp. NPDC059835]